MANARAKYKPSQVRLKRTRRIPPQLAPIPIEREYARELRLVFAEIHAALQPLIDELPLLIESSARERMDMIRRVRGEWLLMTKDGKRVLGRHKTKEEAEAQERVILESQRADAGEAERIRQLTQQAREALAKTITPSRLEAIAQKFGTRTSDAQKKQLAKQIKSALGVDMLSVDRRVPALLRGFVQENVSLISSVPEQVISRTEQIIMRGMQKRMTTRDLAKELSDKAGYDMDRAQRIARDQVGSLYGQVNAARQQDLGIKRFTWRTVGDDAVRDEHAERNGQVYSYDDPPEGELPGEPINCRCSAEPVFADLFEE